MRFDCRSCGACCTPEYDEPDYVHVSEKDLVRLSPHVRERHVTIRPLYNGSLDLSLKTKKDRSGNTVCALLRGTIGKRVSCNIQITKPLLCRSFVKGGANCIQARKQFGLPVPNP